MTWQAFLPIEPMAKARPRVTRRGTYMPREYQDWRKRFCALSKSFDLPQEPMEGRLALILMIYTKSGKMRPDLDNVTGAVLDALQDAGVVKNDRDFVRIHSLIDKDKDPGLQIYVELSP